MAYITGTVNSYDELISVLVSGCQDNGWAWADGILSKGNAFVKVTVSATAQTGSGTPGSGIYIQGGTGKSGATLQNASTTQPRLGRPSPNADYYAAVVWPAIYHLHIFDNPDEVYVVLNFSTQYCYWLAFGVSDVVGLAGSGLWLAGNAPMPGNTTSWGDGIYITPTTGVIDGAGSMLTTCALFWGTQKNSSAANVSDTILSNLDGLGWQGNANAGVQNSFNAISAVAPHLEMTPSNWNQDAPLLPIHGYVWRAENKCSLAVAVQNARYIRVDNYEVGDEITLGTDKWKVYPFYLKNATARNGGSRINHTGTFGWAIRSN